MPPGSGLAPGSHWYREFSGLTGRGPSTSPNQSKLAAFASPTILHTDMTYYILDFFLSLQLLPLFESISGFSARFLMNIMQE